MARGSRNAALIESESLSAEETKLMDDNRAGDQEPYVPDPQPAPDPVSTPTPAADPAATATPAVAPAKETKEDAERKRMVEYGAFHEERERRKQERERREKAEADLNTLKGRFDTIQELVRQAGQQPKPPIPDVNADPVAHFQAQIAERDARLRENEERLQQFDQWRKQQDEQARQQHQIATVRTYAQQSETEFAKETPDYIEAANYVQMIRSAQLEAIGLADPMQRAQQLATEALNLAAGAMQRGQNPAQVVYQMAKASGWKPKAAEPAPIATPSPAAPQPATQKLENVAKGQKANQSLSQVSGSGTPQEPSIETLLKMSDEEFEKATKGDNWRKLFA